MKFEDLGRELSVLGEELGLVFTAKNSAFGFEYFKIDSEKGYIGLVDIQEGADSLRINDIRIEHPNNGFGIKVLSIIKNYAVNKGITRIRVQGLLEDDGKTDLTRSKRFEIFSKIGKELNMRVEEEVDGLAYITLPPKSVIKEEQ